MARTTSASASSSTRAGQQAVLAGRGGPDVLLGLAERGLGQLGGVGDVVVAEDLVRRAGRGRACRCRRSRTGRPAPASGRTCRRRRPPTSRRTGSASWVRGMSKSLIVHAPAGHLGQDRGELGRQVVGVDARDGDAGARRRGAGSGSASRRRAAPTRPRPPTVGRRARTPRRPGCAAGRAPRSGRRDRAVGGLGSPSASPSAATITRRRWPIRTGTRSARPDAQRLADGVGERVGDVEQRGHLRTSLSGRSSGTAVTRASSVGPLVDGEPRQLEDDAVARWTGSRPRRRPGGARP